MTRAEALEPRRLLSTSVTATALTAPLNAGVSLTYQFTGGITGTQTQTVIGPATFNGNSATEIDSTSQFTAPAAQNTTLKSYVALTSQGLVEYGNVSTAVGVTTTTTISPVHVEFPSTLTVGTPFTNTYTYSTTSSIGGTNTSTQTITLTLVSGTPVSVTVPAGTFSAYEVDTTTSASGASGSATVQSWFAPGVGPVKQVVNNGSTPVTEELTSYKGVSPTGTGGTGGTGGTTGTGTVAAALKGSLPTSVVPTMPLNAHNTLTLTASSAAKGAVSTQVLLSPDTTAADSVFTLATGHGAVNLASGKSKTLPLKFAKSIPATVAAGTYNVLLVTTDPSGATQTTVGPQLTVAKAAVDLTGAIVKAPTTAKAGKKVPLTFTISNSSAANVPATGTVTIDLESSPDGLLSDASPLTSITKRINLKPGKRMRVTASVALSTTGFVVVDVDPGNTAFPDDVAPANNVFATAQAIVVA